MQSLLYFLLWAALFFVFMRFGCGAHVMGHGHGRKNRASSGNGMNSADAPLEEVKDPVCGMTVKTASAKSSLYGGFAYYFCSTTCRDKFEASPAAFAEATGVSANTKELHHGNH